MAEALRRFAGLPAASSDERARFERKPQLTEINAAAG
jgi:hypothetical protein